MNREVFITCAVTGSGDTTAKHPGVPITPKQIAEASIEAAKAGAAIAHIHVRDPETGKAARALHLYREVVDRIRSADVDVVINLTAGMGGDVVFGAGEHPLPLDPAGTDMVGPSERLAHVEALLPEICTLDCGTMNFALGDYVMTNTPSTLRAMARKVQALGVRPELEVFDTGHLAFVKQLADAMDPLSCLLSRTEWMRALKAHIAIAVQRGNADIMIQDAQRSWGGISQGTMHRPILGLLGFVVCRTMLGYVVCCIRRD